jgi:hypothetical protein
LEQSWGSPSRHSSLHRYGVRIKPLYKPFVEYVQSLYPAHSFVQVSALYTLPGGKAQELHYDYPKQNLCAIARLSDLRKPFTCILPVNIASKLIVETDAARQIQSDLTLHVGQFILFSNLRHAEGSHSGADGGCYQLHFFFACDQCHIPPDEVYY